MTREYKRNGAPFLGKLYASGVINGAAGGKECGLARMANCSPFSRATLINSDRQPLPIQGITKVHQPNPSIWGGIKGGVCLTGRHPMLEQFEFSDTYPHPEGCFSVIVSSI